MWGAKPAGMKVPVGFLDDTQHVGGRAVEGRAGDLRPEDAERLTLREHFTGLSQHFAEESGGEPCRLAVANDTTMPLSKMEAESIWYCLSLGVVADSTGQGNRVNFHRYCQTTS